MRTKDIEHAAKLWAEGVSKSKISDILNVNLNTLGSMMSRRRDQFPPRSWAIEVDDAQVKAAADLWILGYPASRIANMLDITEARVEWFCMKFRDQFPKRKTGINPGHIPEKTQPSNVMMFKTSWGYECPLPRISILERAI